MPAAALWGLPLLARLMPLFLLAPAAPSAAQGAWTATSQSHAPTGRYQHASVWTGSKMVVWGGWDGTATNTGGVYDPVANAWTATSTTNAPAGRTQHTAVWTGSKMIVWGGDADAGPQNTGGIYDPVTNMWTAISTTNAPTARDGHTAVWTGSKMIVWGGYATGGIYDPVTDTWTATSTTNAPAARYWHTAVWTGSKMIVWGGAASSGSSYVALATGGIYDPATDTWTPTSTTNAPTVRYYHTAVWTGSKMIVWGGDAVAGFTGSVNTGSAYDPVTDTWTATSTTNAPTQRAAHTAVWTGSKMIVWGGGYTSGGLYDPATNTWTATSTANAPSPRYWHTAAWTGAEMIVWGGYDGSYKNTGGIFDPQLADLAITKTDGQASAIAGQPVTYTIKASNAGPAAVTGAMVSDTFPGSLSSVSWTCSASVGGSCAAASGSGDISQTVSLPVSGTATFVATGTLSPTATGTLVNTATVTAPSGFGDTNLANNSATDTDTILVPADVSVTKTDGLATVSPGLGIVYTIVATNAGPNPVSGVIVSDSPLPASLLLPTWTCTAAGGASCTASGSGDISDSVNLPVGGTATYTLSGTLSSNPPALSNTATVTLPAGYGDPNPADNSATDTDVILYPATAFYTVTPCRVVDTRNPAGPSGGPALVGKTTRTFTVTGGACGIPSNAIAVSVNLTAVGAAAAGYLTLYRSDLDTTPTVSTINFSAGQTRANNAVVSLAPDGTIDVKNGSVAAVNIVLDVNGYFQ